jgi:hypothetical protein
MKRIHLILIIIIIVCIGLVFLQQGRQEGFEDPDSGLIFTDAHCGTLLNQAKGMEESIEKAKADNSIGLVNSYTAMLASMKEQIAKIGCKGTEQPAAASIPVPSSMTSDEVAASKVPQQDVQMPSEDVVKSAMALAAKIVAEQKGMDTPVTNVLGSSSLKTP